MFLQYLKDHFFSITLIALIVLAVSGSYVRFLVTYDYIIYDEVECDPYTKSCFIYCEDEECTEPFYYVEMERLASSLMNYCQGDQSDCEAAYWCIEGEENCSITYCDSSEAECEELTEADTEAEVSESIEDGVEALENLTVENISDTNATQAEDSEIAIEADTSTNDQALELIKSEETQ